MKLDKMDLLGFTNFKAYLTNTEYTNVSFSAGGEAGMTGDEIILSGAWTQVAGTVIAAVGETLS
jgi:hypothetical protein